jgi:hypothetical protein
MVGAVKEKLIYRLERMAKVTELEFFSLQLEQEFIKI